MFTIEKRSDLQAPALVHGPNLFHEALQGGEMRYHVDREGAEGYDIQYTKNFAFVESIMPPAFKQLEVFFDFLIYDENKKEYLVLDVFQNYKKVVFLETNEYSIVLGRLILEELKEIDVYYADPRILWFLEPAEHLHVGEQLPEDAADVYFVTAPLGHSYGDSMGNKMSVLTVFQSVFFMQAFAGDRPVEQIKYLNMSLDFAKNGIASILVQTARIRDIFSKVGWKVYNSGETIGKYPREMLEKYFNFTWKPEDAAAENTVVLHQSNSSAMYVTYTGALTAGNVSPDVLKEDFRRQMQEYTDAVFGGKKMLGVLIRGTDYILSGLFGKQVHATCEQMFPKIHEWLDQYHYDGIFLATEDQDILNKMLAEFGSKVRIVSQERFRISDFKDVKLIADLEEEIYIEEKKQHIEDTMVNYVYAMYTLSRCDSFISSGWCNGARLAECLNEGRFAHNYRFEVGKETNI